jgi:hypothetical protein
MTIWRHFGGKVYWDVSTGRRGSPRARLKELEEVVGATAYELLKV